MTPDKTMLEDTSNTMFYDVEIDGEVVICDIKAVDAYDAERRGRIEYRKLTGLEPRTWAARTAKYKGKRL